ncbi:MAG: OmpA family protein, partial [Bacteroidaceae bacterium]|nr:OmpA family protein [Bacteroidaceae bacterium]
ADLLDGSRGLCATLKNDTSLLGSSLRNYQALLASNQSENQKLNTSLLSKQRELADREKTIAQLQEMINAQNEKVKKLLANVKDALLGFSSDELTVREEGGKVYVAMSDKLLFESGKAVVNAQGRNALGKLAQVLNKQTEIDVYIEGHTDNVPIKTAVYQDNWDLSVIRATSVVRILTETYGVAPMQIQPCGRGEFKPVATNETAEGRAKNRRTEIIMAPRLDKLFEMLQNN